MLSVNYHNQRILSGNPLGRIWLSKGFKNDRYLKFKNNLSVVGV